MTSTEQAFENENMLKVGQTTKLWIKYRAMCT